jgi:hypothetical protein
MNIAILTFEGFNELDSFIAAGILNRMKGAGWNVQITCPSDFVTSMNGVKIEAQQPLESAIHYVAPVGEKDLAVSHSMSIVLPYYSKKVER